MMFRNLGTYLFFGLICFSTSLYANQWEYKRYVSIDLVEGYYESDALIGVEFNLQPGWKIYNDQDQEIGMPTSFEFGELDNIKDFHVVYPKAKRFIEAEEFVTYGYKGKVVFPIHIIPVDNEKDINADLIVKFAICKDICIPVSHLIEVDLKNDFFVKENTELINKYKRSNIVIISVVFGAIIAGFILNFMPCVLPVLLLKIVSFLEKRTTDKKTIIIAAVSTLSGIIATFVFLAFCVMMLKLVGHNLGWGIHFQEPLFIGFLIIILIVFASNILGYFHITVPSFLLTRLNYLSNRNDVVLNHFFTGVLATLLATPCSAPFLGPVLTVALTTNYLNVLLVFVSIGVGLSLPYILLIVAPGTLYLLPKPGKWMNKLRELMAVFLIITALWLLIIIYRQIGVYGSILFFMEILILFKMIKHHHKLISLVGKAVFRILLLVNVMICVFVISAYRNHNAEKAIDEYWLGFNDVKIESLLEQHSGVFVNVTADWCLTCKVNEVFILNSKKLRNSFKEYDVVMVKADYTKHDIEIENYLRSFDRYAIPTYVLYNKDYPKGKLLSEINSVNYLTLLVKGEGGKK